MADALDVDLAALDPAPTKVVANLPYGIAATVILRTIDELPGVRQLGRDGPARGRRASGGRARRPPPTAPPRCSHSSRVTSRCCGPSRGRCFARSRTSTRCWSGCAATAAGVDPARARARPRGVRSPPQGARGLAGACSGAAAGVRERARAALVEMGHPADERAERLSPDEFRELAVRLARRERAAGARTGEDQPVPARRPGSRRRAPRGRDRARVGVAVRRARADGAGRRRRRRRGRVSRAWRARIWSPLRWKGCARAAGTGRACGSRSPSGSPWPAGWPAVRRTPPRRCGWRRRLTRWPTR